MPLSPGVRVGPYEVTAQIGAGGMGEVYRARDTKLGREVALKVLPDAFTHDPDRLARFQREAHVLASLNHPNIAHIYGLEDAGSTHALVMELVEGPTLADRIAKGPIPLNEALPIAKQMAEALDAAHEQGIIHRDLKPANVKVREDGTVKVLDFGLAKALDPVVAGRDVSPADLANSPTITSPAMTGLGMILGTAAYMAPEQAAGKPVDKRADIWAFGVVLWEMLTGRLLFDGETVSHTLADVLRAPIDVAALPATTPAPIRELVRRCLDRDVKTRLRDIGEARVVIQTWLANPSAAAGTSSSERVRRPRFGMMSLILAGLAVVIVAAYPFIRVGETPPAGPVVRSSVLPPDEASGFALDANIGGTAISPDGSMLAFVATVKGKPMLWVRPLDSLSARILPGTDDAGRPFWSPDSRNIGFHSHGKLRRIGVTGGAPREICELALPRGASWNADEVIVLSLARPPVLARVSALGGTPVPITALKEREQDHYWPQFLPDGKHFLFSVRTRQSEGVTTAVRVASLDDPPGGSGAPLVESAYGGVFAPNPADTRTGHLLFLQGTSLMAQVFDPVALKLTGQAEPIASDVGGTESNVYVDLSASRTGVLAHGNSLQTSPRVTLLAGRGMPEVATEGAITPRLSPGGRWVVAARSSRVGGRLASGQGARSDVILIDLTQPNNEPRVLTVSGSNHNPVWSPDGNEVVYSVVGQGLFRTRLDGGGSPQPVPATDPLAMPLDWSIDGKFLLYGVLTADSRLIDLRVASMELPAAGKPFTYVAGLPGVGVGARFSPNRTGARWVAYGSRDLPTSRVFVQKFPNPDAPRLVSDDGDLPAWAPDGKALFFRRGRTLMSVAVTMTDGGIAFDTPRHVLDIPGQSSPVGLASAFDVSPDGRFLFSIATEETSRIGNSITLVQNWQAGLKR